MSVPISDFTAAGPYCIWSVVSNPPSILSTVEQRISSESVRIIHWKRKKDDLPGVVQRCRRSEPDSDCASMADVVPRWTHGMHFSSVGPFTVRQTFAGLMYSIFRT